jgi:DNA-binding beta-propeller fold protein YncE
MSNNRTLLYTLFAGLFAFAANPLNAKESFVAFESGQVRPLAIAPGGELLYAVNTPDNRLEVYRIGDNTLFHLASIPVGMEPVAVGVASERDVWVVNKLSDSVSVVRRNEQGFRVVQTLPAGDEPQDIVFAGPDKRFAFISAARRDFARPTTKLIGNADIWVYDSQAVTGPDVVRPVTKINLFTDVPRGLATNADGSIVYAAAHFSGNLTTSIAQTTVRDNLPPPFTNADGVPAPSTALILRYEDGSWLDAIDRDWSAAVPYTLTDNDLFTIDASGEVPQLAGQVEGVGTVLFNVAVNPSNGNVYVSNLESRNQVRFEGAGEFFDSTVRGDIARNRITIVDDEGVVQPRHLNKHIDFSRTLGTPEENAASLAFPLQMEFSPDGETLYVAAFGSSKIGVFDAASLEDDSFTPDPDTHIELWAGGPSGIVLDNARQQAYVLTRFRNSIAVIDLDDRQQVAEFAMFNPEPASIVDGRRFLYDARYTSSRGNSACASCHIFGDKDELAWNLGDPDGEVLPNPNPFVVEPQPGENIDFHPMKGPMTTQSLRGMANHGPMHWRGDRTGGNDPQSGDPLDENSAFKLFNPAFEGLVGRVEPLTPEEMQAFADFALQLTYPPNPLRNADNSLTELQQAGSDFYFNFPTFLGTTTCNGCHRVSLAEGFFGSSGLSINVRRPQVMKIPHVRNAYTKVGRTRDPFTGEPGPIQFKGFAYGHAGSTPTVEDLLAQQDMGRFDFPGGAPQRREVAQWVLAVDSNLAPIVGEQVTVSANRSQTTLQRIGLLWRRARVTEPRRECDLIAKGRLDGVQRGWVLQSSGLFRSDASGDAELTLLDLGQLADVPGQEITLTCVPPGSGVRMGIDRDEDGVLDRDEIVAGSNPQDPDDVPSGT